MGGVKSKFAKCYACCGYRKEKETYGLPPDVSVTPLSVTGIDLCVKNNGKDHHTARFHLMTEEESRSLVVRRGQAFEINILYRGAFNIETDELFFKLHVQDEQSSTGDNTAKIQLVKDGDVVSKGWSAVYKRQTDSFITVSITSPADCIVAAWNIQIYTRTQNFSHIPIHTIYIIFNPWCANDTVYMSDARQREEYVQEDKGLIFMGTSSSIHGTQWCYAQYEKDMLSCAVSLVRNIGQLKGRARACPIRTARGLSAAVNINEDYGVVEGRWSKTDAGYANGKKPWEWVGSFEILQKYYETKKSVKYGQCWVFAGVLTTVCRALGIPCRPVTCFNSAHDSDGNMTVESIINENGEEVQKDSVWNFHVWNEAWMTRPDLGAAYDGWQIIDATPQELSEGLCQCGPTPLAAVFNGETNLPYDVPFVFAEVNADRVVWKLKGSDKQVVLVDTDYVGQNISTKAIGSWEREDLTHRYKSPEGTNRERETLIKALSKSDSDYARYIRSKSFTDVTFELKLPVNAAIGQEFEVELLIQNHSTTNLHHVTGNLSLYTETYRGNGGQHVKGQAFDVNLKPGQTTQNTMKVTFDDYYKKLVDQASFKVLYDANIAASDYNRIDYLVFRLKNPDIKIEFDGMKTLKVLMENPLPIRLSHGQFTVQIMELNKQFSIQCNEVIPPGGSAEGIVTFEPQPHRLYHVVAKFSSLELKFVEGNNTING